MNRSTTPRLEYPLFNNNLSVSRRSFSVLFIRFSPPSDCCEVFAVN